MPSTSKAQHRFMAMAASAKGRAKLKAEGHKMPPQDVASEFMQADKGRVKRLAERARSKATGNRKK